MHWRQHHEDNRVAWNEGAEAYEKDIEARIEFLRNGGTNFEPPEYAYLEGLADWCDTALHLQCAGGTDTLSLWNLGAKQVVGVDISDRMIEVARRKSEALGAPATWIRADVFEVPHELDGTADLVYTGRGAICWLADLNRWASVVARLLKPGGKLYLFEGHPFMNIWDLEASEWKLDRTYGDYFSAETLTEQGWSPTYIGDLGKPVEEHAPKHERLWNLGQVVNAVLGSGLELLKLEEHSDAFWTPMPNMPEEQLSKVPQTFSLLARKKA